MKGTNFEKLGELWATFERKGAYWPNTQEEVWGTKERKMKEIKSALIQPFLY